MTYEDYEWYLEADLSEYSGKWVAIADKRVIAIGDKVEKVVEKAEEMNPNKIPFITKVRAQLSIL